MKRERVAGAVRSLLGLDLLEDAERHVDTARREAVGSIKRLGAGTEVEELVAKRQLLEDRLASGKAGSTGTGGRGCDRIAVPTGGSEVEGGAATGAGEHRRIGVELEQTEAALRREREAQLGFVAAHRGHLMRRH